MNGSYDPRLVLASIVVAIIASYTALDLVGRVSVARRSRGVWLAAGSAAMGIGIWSMHFIGMLALRLPVPVVYETGLWLLSVGVAIAASLLALGVASRERVALPTLAGAGVIMGAAIAGMHYTGMAAMRIPGHIEYDPGWVIASIAVAVGAAIAALCMAVGLRGDTRRQLPWKWAAAVVMGLAIAGMHYTGMHAASFLRGGSGMAPEAHGHLVASDALATAVAGGTLLVLAMALVSVAIDRGVRRRMEEVEALRRSEERFHILVNGLPAIVYQAEPSPPYPTVFVSSAIASLGYTLEEWLARPDSWLSIVHPDDREWVLEHTRQALVTSSATEMEYRVIARDGTVRWMHDHGEFVRDADGSVLYWQGVMLDITDRRQGEVLLEDQRRQLRQIIDVVPHALFARDESGRFLLVNQEFARLYGRTPEEVEGLRVEDIIDDPAVAARFREEDRDVMRTAEASVLPETPYVTRSGEVRLTKTIKVPFHWAGTEQLAVLGLVRDITDDRARELQLRRAERLASVGTLLSGVAHELNNPLAAIKAFASLMLMDARGDDDREALETVCREADRAAKIVSDLRLLSRESQEERPVNRQPVLLADVVRHVLKLRAYSLETRNIRVSAELPEATPLVLADRGQLEQVLLNLVVNAEHALSADGPEPRLTVRERVEGEWIVLEVVDNGPGIPAEQQEKVFDPFWTTKAPGEGTGLGLSLAHAIVREHGGELEVESAPGQGATFRVSLPAAPTDVPPPPGDAPPESSPRALRVLVVDDEAPVRRTLVRYLTRRGHLVDEATDGAEGLVKVSLAQAEGGYAVILSDLRMPGMGGAELFERLRADGNELHRRLVFITGDAASPDTGVLLSRLGVPVLHKPFDLERVAEVVESLGTGRPNGASAA